MASISGPDTHDAVIVGSGPSGSAAALGLVSQGARVVVLERMRLPRYKTCGGGVVARALAWLPPEVQVRPERICHAVELNFLDDGLRFAVERSEPIVNMTMRAEFDSALLAAAERAGAEIRAECTFQGFSANGGALQVQTSRGPLRAEFLIGADGALGEVARRAGWAKSIAGVPALECELTVPERELDRFAAAARFDFSQPPEGYAWVFPKTNHLSAGILSMRRGPAHLKELLRVYLDRIGVAGILGMELHGFQIPVRPRSEGFARGRVLLVGDAAGLADPITGEGISYAIRSGQLAARAWAAGGQDPAHVGRAYTAALGREVLQELRIGRVLSRITYGLPPIRRALFRSFGQSICEAVTEVILGRMSYRDLITRLPNYLKLLFGRAAM